MLDVRIPVIKAPLPWGAFGVLLPAVEEQQLALQILDGKPVLVHDIAGRIHVRVVHVTAAAEAPEPGAGAGRVAPGPGYDAEADLVVLVAADVLPHLALDADRIVRNH